LFAVEKLEPYFSAETQGTQRRIIKTVRQLLITSALALLSIASAMQSSASRLDKSCREHPQLVSNCFKVRGRLAVYNGAPALRIWKIGTKRMLGVSEQRFAIAGVRNVPEDVQTKIDQNKFLYGDFVVCPFTASRTNEMQLVCIDRVTNLRIKER
jgi:hypothetical protein